METIKNLIEEENYAELLSACEELEFNLALTPNANISPEDLYSPYLAGYLLLNQLPAARFLWKRIPDRAKAASEQLRAIWSVTTALWKREFANVYGLIEGKPWSPLVAPLMDKLTKIVRERVLNLLSEAYSAISVDDAVRYLGTPQDQLLPILIERGWSHDASTNTLQPKKTTEFKDFTPSFQLLSDLVIQLEKQPIT